MSLRLVGFLCVIACSALGCGELHEAMRSCREADDFEFKCYRAAGLLEADHDLDRSREMLAVLKARNRQTCSYIEFDTPRCAQVRQELWADDPDKILAIADTRCGKAGGNVWCQYPALATWAGYKRPRDPVAAQRLYAVYLPKPEVYLPGMTYAVSAAANAALPAALLDEWEATISRAFAAGQLQQAFELATAYPPLRAGVRAAFLSRASTGLWNAFVEEPARTGHPVRAALAAHYLALPDDSNAPLVHARVDQALVQEVAVATDASPLPSRAALASRIAYLLDPVKYAAYGRDDLPAVVAARAEQEVGWTLARRTGDCPLGFTEIDAGFRAHPGFAIPVDVELGTCVVEDEHTSTSVPYSYDTRVQTGTERVASGTQEFKEFFPICPGSSSGQSCSQTRSAPVYTERPVYTTEHRQGVNVVEHHRVNIALKGMLSGPGFILPLVWTKTIAEDRNATAKDVVDSFAYALPSLLDVTSEGQRARSERQGYWLAEAAAAQQRGDRPRLENALVSHVMLWGSDPVAQRWFEDEYGLSLEDARRLLSNPAAFAWKPQ
jgi:hypothetical protein